MNSQEHITAIFIGNAADCEATIKHINGWIAGYATADLPKVIKGIDKVIANIDAERKAQPYGKGRVQRLRNRRNLVMRKMVAIDRLTAAIQAC